MALSDSVSDDVRDLDLEVYKSLRDYEEHFNRTQVEVKKLASAWMLATFAAIAFLVRGDLFGRHSLLDSSSLLVLIGTAGNIGLLSLWILDQPVNQRLLGAAFRVGMLIERTYSELPPIRSKMWVNSRSRGMGRLHAFYYLCPMAFNLAASLFGLLQSPASRTAWLVVVLIASAATMIAPFMQWWHSWFSSAPPGEEAVIRKTVEDWERAHRSDAEISGQGWPASR